MSRGRAAAAGKRSAVELLIIETLEPTPEDATHWSTRSMAAEVGLSERGVADLAGIRAAAASAGDPGALVRSPVVGQIS
jgi:hypothetical protein